MTKPRRPQRIPTKAPTRTPTPPQPQRHIDGTLCKEGTARLPAGAFTACCAEFGNHTVSCDYDVRYEWWEPARLWVIAIAETAGGGGIAIHFCPHCGTKLAQAGARRGRWLEVDRPRRAKPRAARRAPRRR